MTVTEGDSNLALGTYVLHVRSHCAQGVRSWEGTLPQAQALRNCSLTLGSNENKNHFCAALKGKVEEPTKHGTTCAASPCYAAAVGCANGTVSHASF